jgi:phosphoglycerol transferase MdoB-like AlkP superfamily enzyme
MKWTRFLTFKIQKEPGFRLNLIDIGLIACLILVTWLLYPIFQEGWLFLLPLYIGLSFFLFCNVFRIGNWLEPFWYIPFTIALFFLNKQPEILWWLILLVFEPLKVILIAYSMKRGDDRGIRL